MSPTACCVWAAPSAGRADAALLSFDRMEHNARILGGGWAQMWAEGVGGMIHRRRAWLEVNGGRLVRPLTD